MTRRVLWAAHWLLTLAVAAAADVAASLLFTGSLAGTVGILAATGVCLIGFAWAPHPGGAR